jgi:CBS domain-containing protein
VGTRGAAQSFVQSHGVRVKDVMTRSPAVVAQDTPVDAIVRLMETRKIKRLPVTRGVAKPIALRPMISLFASESLKTLPRRIGPRASST